MIDEIEIDRAAVAAGFTPRVLLDAEEVTVSIVVDELVVFEIDGGGSVSDIEIVTSVSRDGRIFGSKFSLAVGSVTAHGLVEENVFVGGRLAV